MKEIQVRAVGKKLESVEATADHGAILLNFEDGSYLQITSNDVLTFMEVAAGAKKRRKR